MRTWPDPLSSPAHPPRKRARARLFPPPSRFGERERAVYGHGHAYDLASCGYLGILMRAGMPTAIAPAGTSSSTTALAPMRAPSPMVTPPRILAPGPTSTAPPSTG